MIDTYHKGQWNQDRFIPEKTKKLLGGAANTACNAAALCSLVDIDVRVGWGGLPNDRQDWFLELIRLENSKGKILELYNGASPIREKFYHQYGLKLWIKEQSKLKGQEPLGLIISDYNRGMANEHRARIMQQEHLGRFNFVVVDSRYRSTDLSLIESIPIKIFRCTGLECDKEWAKNFDYVVSTNGASTIIVEEVKTGFIAAFTPPQVKVIDDCGAGDTFTAALGAHLLQRIQSENNVVLDFRSILHAAEFASLAASDVVQKEYTAVTDIKL